MANPSNFDMLAIVAELSASLFCSHCGADHPIIYFASAATPYNEPKAASIVPVIQAALRRASKAVPKTPFEKTLADALSIGLEVIAVCGNIACPLASRRTLG